MLTGERAAVLRNRPPEIVELYAALEAFVKSLGPVEFVTRERYVLLRGHRIFADPVIMSGALRLAVHLSREAKNRLFSVLDLVESGLTAPERLKSAAEKNWLFSTYLP